MSITTIQDVTISRTNEADLLGCFIDNPKPGSGNDTYGFDLTGWVLGRSSAVKKVEVLSQGTILQTAIVKQARPDIAHAFPESLAAGNSGFHTQVNLVGVPPEFELTLVAVHDNGQRSPFGSIRGNRNRLGLANCSMLQPLLVTTIGRTGSTWFMRLLGQHQSIVTYRPFEFEPRAGTYWVQVFRALSDPKSYLQPLIVTEPVGRWWLGPDTMEPPRNIPDLDVVRCIGGTGVSSLAVFCQEQLEALYRAVAAASGLAAGKYFAEKYQGGESPFVRAILWEWYPGTKEVVLVRDPRDIFCSIESFNAKRGYLAFARDRMDDEVEYVRMLIRMTKRLLQIWKERSSAVHLLRYEDLLREPSRTFSAVLDYLEVDSGTKLVEGLLQRASTETPAMRYHRTSEKHSDSVGRWRRELRANLQELFHSEMGETLTQLGYG